MNANDELIRVGMIDWRGAALARDCSTSRICYSALLAQECVQEAAPANVPSVSASPSLFPKINEENRWVKTSPWVIRGSRLFPTR